MPRPSIEQEPTLIDRLRVCMSAASRLATAAVDGIRDGDVSGVITARQAHRVAGYIGDAVLAAKRSDDTPHARAKVVRQLVAILRQLESDELRMLDTRRRAIAQRQLSVTTATIAQVLAVVGDGEEMAA